MFVEMEVKDRGEYKPTCHESRLDMKQEERWWITLHQIQKFWMWHPLKLQDSFVSMLVKYHHLGIDGCCLHLDEVF